MGLISNPYTITQELIDLTKNTIEAAEKGEKWAKSISTTTGIIGVNLEAPSKKLFPVRTKIRNRTARKGGGYGTKAEWKAITGINTANVDAAVTEGARGGNVTLSLLDKSAAYKSLGLDDDVTFEAVSAAKNFEDARTLSDIALMAAVMEEEEKYLLGGNNSTTGIALGTPTAPTVTTATSGGTIAAATYNIIVVALTLIGWNKATRTGTLALVANKHRSAKSTATSQATTGTTSTLSADTPVVSGAVAYAWYVGTSTNETLQKITTINSVKLTALSTGNQNASALTSGDVSQDANSFDGLLTQVLKDTTGSGPYDAVLTTLATGTAGTGTVLTGDGAGGIAEFDDVLETLWNDKFADPSYAIMNTEQRRDVTKKVLNVSGAVTRVNVDLEGEIISGKLISKYVNKFTDREIDIISHPFWTPGRILLVSEDIPYPQALVETAVVIDERVPYSRYDFALATRKHEYGIYVEEVLKMYFPGGCAVINNIAKG